MSDPRYCTCGSHAHFRVNGARAVTYKCNRCLGGASEKVRAKILTVCYVTAIRGDAESRLMVPPSR